MSSISFQTKARTIDHLGREQIADCPTAISELWKNSYDAYARRAELHLFNDDKSVAAIVDDGHGMNHHDLITKWLVIGTESKASGGEIDLDDLDGLNERPKQGQKGIGRLSSAILGSLLLLVSKRKNSKFVAALIDWRLFENPFLYLDDLKIPVEEFTDKRDLIDLLPVMYDELMSNIWGSPLEEDKERSDRIELAWQQYSLVEHQSFKQKKLTDELTTKEKIENTLISSVYEEYHLEKWPVWNGSSEKGTALFISNIHDDLKAQYGDEDDPLVARAKVNFFSTLISFTDHVIKNNPVEFDYKVVLHKDSYNNSLVSPDLEFSHDDFEKMEHRVVGIIDDSAIFKGQIHAFGHDLGDVVIPLQIKMPFHHLSKVGQVNIFLASYEVEKGKGELGGVRSSMEPGVWNDINEKMRRYNGLKVYRDGLRVMPYGKQSNDFFEVETRRSKNAGAAHYSLRNMIGAISLTKKYNSNLKDKAGREGFIDNKASKAFRDIIELLLVEVANRYFGRSSKSIRGTFTKPLEEDYQQRKAALDLKEQKAKDKKAFNNNLKSYAPKVIELLTQTKLYLSEVESLEKNSENILKLQKKAGDIGQKILTIKISNAPRTLKGNQETLYREYKSNLAFIQNTLKETQTFLNSELERLKPKEPGELAYSQLQRNAKYIQDQLRAWKVEARGILSKEQQRIDALIDEKNKQYHKIAQPYIAEVESNRMSLAKCLELLDRKREEIQFENEQIFSPYLSTLSSLKESIDLAGLAYFSIDQADEMREEIDRLNSLAQLGITVEIISHELHHMQHDTEIALEKVTDQIKDKSTTENLVRTYRALNEKLKFLSPLKLSGEAERDWISGHEIKDYIEEFYGNSINDINLEFSSKFLTLNVYDEKSRIFPVFINLINNSKYWVKQKDNNAQQILLDIVNDKVVISDDGTGVHEDDIKSLFTIFFTKKVRGGRGVGLHLCRSNLAAAGHTIEYAKAPEYQLLNGANFVINFKGVKYDG